MQRENDITREDSRTIRDRIIALWVTKGLSARDLEKATDVDRTKWYALRNGRRRANEEDIMALVKVFPEHALWLVSGETAPEAGQTSPEA